MQAERFPLFTSPTEEAAFQDWVKEGCVTFSAEEHGDFLDWQMACEADDYNDRIMMQQTYGTSPLLIY